MIGNGFFALIGVLVVIEYVNGQDYGCDYENPSPSSQYYGSGCYSQAYSPPAISVPSIPCLPKHKNLGLGKLLLKSLLPKLSLNIGTCGPLPDDCDSTGGIADSYSCGCVDGCSGGCECAKSCCDKTYTAPLSLPGYTCGCGCGGHKKPRTAIVLQPYLKTKVIQTIAKKPVKICIPDMQETVLTPICPKPCLPSCDDACY